MRVIPIHACVGECERIGKRVAGLNGLLRHIRNAVKGIFHAHTVGMNGILHVRVVFEVNGYRGPLCDLQSRSRNRTIVGEHSHFCVADFFLNKARGKVKCVSILEFYYLCFLGGRQSLNAG